MHMGRKLKEGVRKANWKSVSGRFRRGGEVPSRGGLAAGLRCRPCPLDEPSKARWPKPQCLPVYVMSK